MLDTARVDHSQDESRLRIGTVAVRLGRTAPPKWISILLNKPAKFCFRLEVRTEADTLEDVELPICSERGLPKAFQGTYITECQQATELATQRVSRGLLNTGHHQRLCQLAWSL